MIAVDDLLAHGFEKAHYCEEEWISKPIPVRTLSSSVRSLFDGTDVNDEDMAVIWVVLPEEVGVYCNAYMGAFRFGDATGLAILCDAGFTPPEDKDSVHVHNTHQS